MSVSRSFRRPPHAAAIWRAVIVSAILMGSGTLAAQDTPPNLDALLERRMETYRDHLDLSADQETKVRNIQSEHLQKMADTLRKAQEKTRPRARMRALREARDLRTQTTARMSEILSADQMKTYETLLAAQEEEMRARFAARRTAEK